MAGPLALALALLAEEPRPVRARLALDVPLTLAAGAGWLALYALAPRLTRTRCPCAPTEVNPVDRPVIGLRWRYGEPLADVAVAASVGAAALALALPGDVSGFANDLALATEAALLAGLTTQAVKIAAARPYPYMYDAPAPDQERDGVNYHSFWSGHAAVPAAAATAAALLLAHRGAPGWLRALSWGVAPALALAAGTLQVSAGNHFPTDVAAGALAGAATGAAVVLLHAE